MRMPQLRRLSSAASALHPLGPARLPLRSSSVMDLLSTCGSTSKDSKVSTEGWTWARGPHRGEEPPRAAALLVG